MEHHGPETGAVYAPCPEHPRKMVRREEEGATQSSPNQNLYEHSDETLRGSNREARGARLPPIVDAGADATKRKPLLRESFVDLYNSQAPSAPRRDGGSGQLKRH